MHKKSSLQLKLKFINSVLFIVKNLNFLSKGPRSCVACPMRHVLKNSYNYNFNAIIALKKYSFHVYILKIGFLVKKATRVF